MAAISTTITLSKDNILYDIENTAYVVGLNRSTGVNFEQVSNIQNTGEGGDRDMVLRSIETAFNEIKRNVNRFIDDTAIATTSTNDPTDGTTAFSLTLTMPGNFNKASVDSIKSASHEYIVAHALIDWFTAVKPDEVAIYVQKKTDAGVNILSALYRKKAPVRPT